MAAEISMEYVGGGSMITMLGEENGAYEPGMALTLKDANTVGLGVAGGSPVFGIVTKVEERDGVPCLGLQVTGFTERAYMTTTAANRPAVGSHAYCNNNGALVKAPDSPAGVPCGIVTAINTNDNTATVRLF